MNVEVSWIVSDARPLGLRTTELLPFMNQPCRRLHPHTGCIMTQKLEISNLLSDCSKFGSRKVKPNSMLFPRLGKFR
jgi:hypothetical protein